MDSASVDSSKTDAEERAPSPVPPTPSSPSRVLVIDDDVSLCELVEAELVRRDLRVRCSHSAHDALAVLEHEDFDLIMVDVHLPGMSGVDLCKELVARREDVPVIMVTAFVNVDVAIAGIRAGAYDFITKPIDAEQLAVTIDRALRHGGLRNEVTRLRHAVDAGRPFDDILGTSPAIVKMCDLIARVSDSETTALITGESGTGKELVARAIHARSGRKDAPFVAINCAAMPENLLESELFGHVKGAFTDARTSRPGLFVRASKGTLFLDEIGEMPLGMQAKLLRALQERKARPVGGDEEQPFDTRIVAATNRDLETEVAEKRFREDLFYRVNVVRIHVPPLRARGGDILLLARHLLARYAAQSRRPALGFSSGAAEKLAAYAWPGNVRELQNCLERAVALASSDVVEAGDLPDKIREYHPVHITIESNDPTDLLSMDAVERRYIAKVLEAVGGNKTLAAQVLGFDRRTLYRKLERHDSSRAEPPPSGGERSNR